MQYSVREKQVLRSGLEFQDGLLRMTILFEGREELAHHDRVNSWFLEL